MNKLTEIKDTLNKLNNSGYSMATQCTAEDNLQCYGEEWLRYLISLLEEKDKALEFYAEYDNHKWKVEAGDYFMTNYTNVTQDYGKIARKALNTSSNQEGENQ